jgi:hypothetical protein
MTTAIAISVTTAVGFLAVNKVRIKSWLREQRYKRNRP